MDRSFYARDPVEVAEQLLGCTLIHDKIRGRIVETEAYYGNQDIKDPASHAFTGETARNQVMFGDPGRSYVYRCYGIHNLLNVTTSDPGTPGAVLIRAVEPVTGVDTMRDRRGMKDETTLCSGPGKLCEAFDITTEHNDIDLTQGRLHIAAGDAPQDVVQTTRIGISEGTELELRFYVDGNPHVSVR